MNCTVEYKSTKLVNYNNKFEKCNEANISFTKNNKKKSTSESQILFIYCICYYFLLTFS